ncbi:MAG TPA: hypothetical protein VFT08_06470 [Pyrinomonadaceae bacterium]|nr:hypothetical protein [Pyrinomonadaceae bacterium]
MTGLKPFGVLSPRFEATVNTDKLDYQPGETALISGAGFWPNETVTLQVTHVTGHTEEGLGHEPWTVTADSFGQFYSSWFVDPDDNEGSWLLLTARGNSSGLSAEQYFTDANPAADLDQCANGPADAPVNCTAATDWVNGNLGASKAHYQEGQSIPYRLKFSNLSTSGSHTVTIEWDTTQSGKHALDYLTSFDRSVTLADPCAGISGCNLIAGPKDLEPIPVDNNVTIGHNRIDDPPAGSAGGDDIAQLGGNFTLFNGTITGLSAYTVSGSYATNSSTKITITFTASTSNPVLAWGGHIGTRIDWGAANSAIAISGSPYHMRLLELNGAGGNQDRSLSAEAVIFPASITIIKDTEPNNARDFDFSTTGAGLSSFSLDDDGDNTNTLSNAKTFGGLITFGNQNPRTITESDPAPDYTLTNLVCLESIPSGSTTTSTLTRTATIILEEGEAVTCTFTNSENFNSTKGRIIVSKVTAPSPDATNTSFDFTANYDADGFSLKNGESNDSCGADNCLTPGNTFNVSETVPTGWDLAPSCTLEGGGATGTPGATGVTGITVEAGKTTTCTFTNTKRGSIKVVKNTVGGDGTFNFTSNFGLPASLTTSGGTKEETVNDLVPGNGFDVSETVPSGWDLSAPSCTLYGGGATGTGNATGVTGITVQAGKTTTCTFTNTKRGTIIVEKQTIPDNAVGNFTFTGTAAGTISDNGTIVVGNLVPGTYGSIEGDPTTAFDLTSIVCDDGGSLNASSGNVNTRTATFKLDPGETVKCTFTNTQRGKAKVIKTVSGAVPSGTHAFTFQLRQGASTTDTGTTLDTKVANAANGGVITFTPDLSPAPTTYQVCEIVMPGWSTTLGSFVPDSFMPPDGVAPNPNVDNSILCVNFTVQPGETKEFTVDNTPPPGGRALTIGFWKNWSSCTGGGQGAELDKKLFIASNLQPGIGLVVSAKYLGTGWSLFAPPYYLTLKGGVTENSSPDCMRTVNLLNKSTANGKKKMASDPLFNLAAQLIAAQLNYFAGAGKTPTTTTNINMAVVLLGKYGFNGDTYSPKLTNADIAKANCLATQLDNYNNNRPVSSCP